MQTNRLDIFLKLAIYFAFLLAATVNGASQAASGTLIVTKNGESTLVLLARPKSRSFFELTGGTTELSQAMHGSKPELETDYQTAIRETVEETRGFFGHRELRRLSHPERWRIEVDGFVIYRVLTSYFELKELFSIKLPTTEPAHWTPMLEIADYAWVDIAAISSAKNSRLKDTTGREIAIRQNLPEYIRQAKKQGWF